MPVPVRADGGLPCSWQPIMKFINDQYERYLQEEVSIDRKKRIPDTRVHCCLYFIPATGHSYVPRGAWGVGAVLSRPGSEPRAPSVTAAVAPGEERARLCSGVGGNVPAIRDPAKPPPHPPRAGARSGAGGWRVRLSFRQTVAGRSQWARFWGCPG